jgi:hypothetical protein
MRTKRLLLMATALVAFGTAPAAAGPCSDEIANVTKLMASRDAGSGPTGTSAGAAGAGQMAAQRQAPTAGSVPGTEATAAMSAATQGRATSPQDVRSQIEGKPAAAQAGQGAAQTTGSLPGTEATAAMSQAAEGRATSPADVRAQIQGQPTSAQAAQGASGQQDNVAQATAALERARMLDRQGNETECMASAMQAKRLFGEK